MTPPFYFVSLLSRKACGLPRLALCAAWVCSAAVAAWAGSVGDLDRENGLPNAKLGAPIAAFRSMDKIEEAGRWETYKQPGEKLKYQGFEVVAIKYNFLKGKLYSINVEIDGRRSVQGILKALERDFGTTHTLEKHHPADADTELEIREWTGSKVYLLYKSAGNGRGAEITFLDRPTWDQLQIPREQRAATFRRMMDGSFINGDF
jgi:hypothetical protein